MSGLPHHQPKLRLMQKTGCSEEQATFALSQGGESLLDAMLYLENQGITPTSPGAGEFSTQHRSATVTYGALTEGHELPPLTWKHFFRCIKKELFENFLEVWYKGSEVFQVPVLVVMILIPPSYGILFFCMIASLFGGVCYQFTCKESIFYPLNRNLQEMARKCHKYWRGHHRKG